MAQPDIDWALWRVFLAVADKGSLSGAARALSASQPTVGRQVQTLEQRLGVELFHRQPKGMVLTDTGAGLLTHARAMAENAQQLSLLAAGQDSAPQGTVRLTASVFVAHHILPPIISDLHRTEPGIDIELVASDSSDNLLYREADIALRMYRPTQLDLITTHLGDIAMGTFAAQSYLARRGRPDTPGALIDHDLIGFDRSDMILRGMRAGGIDVGRGDFAFRTDHPTVYWELLRAGCGIGFGQIAVAARDPSLEQLLPELPIPPLPLWLAAPSQTRHTPRIDRAWGHLKQALIRHIAQSAP